MPRDSEQPKPYPGASTLQYVSGLSALPTSIKGSRWSVGEAVLAALLIALLVWLFA